MITGGFGEHVTEYYNRSGRSIRILNIAIPDEYVEHGNVEILRREVGIDKDTIVKRAMEAYRECVCQNSSAAGDVCQEERICCERSDTQ